MSQINKEIKNFRNCCECNLHAAVWITDPITGLDYESCGSPKCVGSRALMYVHAFIEMKKENQKLKEELKNVTQFVNETGKVIDEYERMEKKRKIDIDMDDFIEYDSYEDMSESYEDY